MKKLILILTIFLLFLIGTHGTNVLAASASSENITLGVIPSGSLSPFHEEVASGMSISANERNWSVLIIAPDREENISAQKDAMQSLIEKPVQIISLNTLDEASLETEIEKATSADIPVLMHNTLTPGNNQNITEYIGYNQFTGGAEMGSYACRLLAEKKNEGLESVQGKVFILRGLPGFHSEERTNGFLTGITQSPGIVVVGQEVAGWDRETARKIADRVLANDSKIDIFFADSDEMAIGASIAARQRGKTINSDIYCLGIDGNAPTLEMIKNSTMTATLGVYPDKMGKTVVEQAEKILNGDTVPLYLETPSVVVDNKNIDAYLNGSLWTGAIESLPEKLHS